MSNSRLYCRLCAEKKPYADITSGTTLEDVQFIEKLSTFGLSFVDFSNKALPTTVCITCYELLVVSYEFFAKIKRSQVVLSEICGLEVRPEIKYDTPNHEVKAERDDGDDEDYLQDCYSASFGNIQSNVKDENYTEIKLIKEDSEEALPNYTLSPANPIECTWDTYPWHCALCDISTGSLEALRTHCRTGHLKCGVFKCADCLEQLHSFAEFVKHVRCHRENLRNICPYCNDNMGSEDSSHIEEHTISLHPCSICGEIFPNKTKLLTHTSFQPPSSPKKRKKPCGEIFPNKTKLLTHLPTQPFSSPKKRQKGVHSVINSECKVCGVIMKTAATMKNHLKKHTNRNRDYTCDRCGKAYYTKGSLDEHNKIHDKKTKESCKICLKTFLTVSRLKKHVKTHNFELPFQCDECKRFFSSKDRIREHVKVHMNRMPFQCQYCTKKFRHKSIMKTHENQHTGARPYSCDICCMDFTNWSNCNKHMKRKHGTTLAKNAMTPHGKLALDPNTGKPEVLVMDKKVKEWSVKMLTKRKKSLVEAEDKEI